MCDTFSALNRFLDELQKINKFTLTQGLNGDFSSTVLEYISTGYDISNLPYGDADVFYAFRNFLYPIQFFTPETFQYVLRSEGGPKTLFQILGTLNDEGTLMLRTIAEAFDVFKKRTGITWNDFEFDNFFGPVIIKGIGSENLIYEGLQSRILNRIIEYNENIFRGVPLVAKNVLSEWDPQLDSEGRTYYFNIITEETTWSLDGVAQEETQQNTMLPPPTEQQSTFQPGPPPTASQAVGGVPPPPTNQSETTSFPPPPPPSTNTAEGSSSTFLPPPPATSCTNQTSLFEGLPTLPEFTPQKYEKKSKLKKRIAKGKSFSPDDLDAIVGLVLPEVSLYTRAICQENTSNQDQTEVAIIPTESTKQDEENEQTKPSPERLNKENTEVETQSHQPPMIGTPNKRDISIQGGSQFNTQEQAKPNDGLSLHNNIPNQGMGNFIPSNAIPDQNQQQKGSTGMNLNESDQNQQIASPNSIQQGTLPTEKEQLPIPESVKDQKPVRLTKQGRPALGVPERQNPRNKFATVNLQNLEQNQNKVDQPLLNAKGKFSTKTINPYSATNGDGEFTQTNGRVALAPPSQQKQRSRFATVSETDIKAFGEQNKANNRQTRASIPTPEPTQLCTSPSLRSGIPTPEQKQQSPQVRARAGIPTPEQGCGSPLPQSRPGISTPEQCQPSPPARPRAGLPASEKREETPPTLPGGSPNVAQRTQTPELSQGINYGARYGATKGVQTQLKEQQNREGFKQGNYGMRYSPQRQQKTKEANDGPQQTSWNNAGRYPMGTPSQNLQTPSAPNEKAKRVSGTNIFNGGGYQTPQLQTAQRYCGQPPMEEEEEGSSPPPPPPPSSESNYPPEIPQDDDVSPPPPLPEDADYDDDDLPPPPPPTSDF